MTPHATPLAGRRQRLLARSAHLRRELGAEAGRLSRRLYVADRLFALGRSPWIRMLVAAAAALLLFRRPRRVLRIGLRFAALYPALRPIAVRIGRFWRARRPAAATLSPQPECDPARDPRSVPDPAV
ncbi:MAG TPA: hypothetical protein VMV25_13020 [Steroidobacteraceae bacterium]|nr:hypothetical protein [Steroidobacteraceae bacterium]